MKYKVTLRFIQTREMIVDSEEEAECGVVCANEEDARAIAQDFINDLGSEAFDDGYDCDVEFRADEVVRVE